MNYASNMTPHEAFRVLGTLPNHVIEDLLEQIEGQPDVEAAVVHIREARHPFSAEDFLADVIKDVAELRTKVRGANKDLADRIAAKLDDIAQTVFNACDHADDELNNALKALGEPT